MRGGATGGKVRGRGLLVGRWEGEGRGYWWEGEGEGEELLVGRWEGE